MALDLSQMKKAPEAPATDQVNTENAEAAIEAEFAFMVYKKPDGQLVLSGDLTAPVRPAREATHDEVYSAFHVLQKDMIVQQTAATSAQAVLQMQQALMQQVQGSSEFEKIRQQLARER